MDLSRGLKVAAGAQRASSFSGAARQVGVTPASVAKLIARLEARLGMRLFECTTHHMAITEEGRDLMQRLDTPVREVDEALSMGRAAVATRGAVKVSVPASFARMAVIPALADFQTKFPDIQLDLRLANRRVGHQFDHLLESQGACAVAGHGLRDGLQREDEVATHRDEDHFAQGAVGKVPVPGRAASGLDQAQRFAMPQPVHGNAGLA